MFGLLWHLTSIKKKVHVSLLPIPHLNLTNLHSRPATPTMQTSIPQTATQQTSTQHTSTPPPSTQQTSTCRQPHFLQQITLDVSAINSIFGLPWHTAAIMTQLSIYQLILTVSLSNLDPQFYRSTLKFTPKSQPIELLLSPPECNITFEVTR